MVVVTLVAIRPSARAFFAHCQSGTSRAAIASSLLAAKSLQPAFQVIYQPDDTCYVGLGPLKEFSISDDWSRGVGVAAGYYHKGDGQDLDQELEFHSRVRVSYRLDTANRLRAELGHLSNAELDDVNPGTEFVSMNWVYEF